MIDTDIDAIPTEVKAIALARFHLAATARRAAALRVLRSGNQMSRAIEGFWLAFAALEAHYEKRVLTQRAFVQRLSGVASSATVSRVLQDQMKKGWVTLATDPTDQRSQTIALTEPGLKWLNRRIDAIWETFWPIVSAPVRSNPPGSWGPPGGPTFEARALAASRMHLAALGQRAAILRRYRSLDEMSRANVAFGVMCVLIVGHGEGRSVTQKDMVAFGSGVVSEASISRAIRDLERERWLTVAAGQRDRRVTVLRPSRRAVRVLSAVARAGWNELWSIAKAAFAN